MQHYMINTIDDLIELQKYVADNNFPLVSFDLETDGVNESICNIYGIGIAFQEDEAFYIPLKNNKGEEWFNDINPIVDWVTQICKSKKLIGHNIIFDTLVWDYSFGINLVPYIYSDTILMKHMIDEERPFGLKEVAIKYLGEWADKAQKEMYDSIEANGGSITKTNLEMYKADTDILGKYCAWDVMLTLKLFNIFQLRLEKEGLSKLFYEDETMPLYREVTIPMKRQGITLDTEHFRKIKVDIQAKLIELEDKLYSDIYTYISDFEIDFLDIQDG